MNADGRGPDGASWPVIAWALASFADHRTDLICVHLRSSAVEYLSYQSYRRLRRKPPNHR
jgi:hypothetical protein